MDAKDRAGERLSQACKAKLGRSRLCADEPNEPEPFF